MSVDDRTHVVLEKQLVQLFFVLERIDRTVEKDELGVSI